ncbi:UDP-N-acetylmuramoylalanine/D-glutamate ligase [Sulfurihydrogenibium sp. YO3AOP1]|uniref:UDP-N-acetylmuramoyl-L-alanine--D-glutamate ligase n=1 Tax=Sulfurihydrogenibium sp. (strain YO3AOP1) TaxID=436114 RepID=UPI00017243AA|nr:UDP-N-acetylmuramoyl-L-alanine--D-glutamate ligase [Sulfurihydrogenibium sp. YO3AOP1]ACD66059.1 UDP-N-acetylmuramoylalanine/D-glutamate ligase [Sulfurihydrogenibium sp. YO3AOP1]
MVLIYGKGKTGESIKKYLEKKNIKSLIIDDNDPLPENENIDTIIVSPGVPFFNRIFKYAKKRKIPIISEIEFAYRQCNDNCEIIAITGTDGKTTTTSLIYEVLKEISDENVYVGGNYGIPFVEILDKIEEASFSYQKPLDQEDNSLGKANSDKTMNKNNISTSHVSPLIVVLELSSFQIYSTNTLKPKVSIILNISTDHLDWHKKEKHYILSKLKLLKNTEFSVLNYNDKCLKNIKGKNVYYFSLKELPEDVKGIYLKEYRKEDGLNVYNLVLKDDKTEEIQVKTQLIGFHNLQNIMATILTAYLLNVNINKVIEKIKEFKPLNHRIEFVKEVEGVKFYNDSKSTTVQAVEKAIESFDEKIVLILGGINKGGDFSKLGSLLKTKVLSAFIIGRDKEQIFRMIKDYTNSIKKESLEEAVKDAFEVAKSNKAVVLFSPGCASFDMFKNYADRGNKFKEIVESLNGKK